MFINTNIKNMKSRSVRLFLIVFSILSAFIFPSGLSAQESVKYESEIKENLTSPRDVAMSPKGELFVLDAGLSAVMIYDAEGKYLSRFGEVGSLPGQFLNPTSIAVSFHGRVVVADSGNNRIQVFNLAGELLYAFGSAGSLPGQFKSLSGVTIDSGGFIYAADRDNKRIQIFSPNGIFMREVVLEGRPVDIGIAPQGFILALLPDSSKIVKISGQGRKIGEIVCKTDRRNEVAVSDHLEIDPWGDIFLTQLGDQRIVKIDPAGNILITFGSEGDSRGQFNGIAGMVTDESRIVYAVDSGNKRVQIFKVMGPKKNLPVSTLASNLLVDFDSTINGEAGMTDVFSMPGWGVFAVSDKKSHVLVRGQAAEENIYGAEGSGEGQLLGPSAVFVTLDGRIFVADSGNHRVQIFNSDGTFNYMFGKNGTKAGQFNSPQGIAVTSKGMILVADTGNHRIQVFNQDGIYLYTIGIPLDAENKVKDACEMLHAPRAIAVNDRDELYVLDSESIKIKVFDENGQCLRMMGEKGTGPGQLTKPVDLAIDENGNVYVADQSNSRIQIFDGQGNYILSFGSPGNGSGYFQQIAALAVSEGRIFVADYLDDQIQAFRYSPDGLTEKPERLFSTATSAPLPGMEGNIVLRYTMARKLAMSEAVREFVDNFGFSKEYLQRFIRVESIESLRDGKVKVSISIPKHIPKELRPVESPSPNPGG